MSYLIVKNFFAPKCNKYAEKSKKKIHAISYNKCNFNCRYCDFHFIKNTNTYTDYDEESFKEKIQSMLPYGNSFKFTGGEATLNPQLMEHLQIVKDLGGIVYLDSNGSNVKVIKEAIEQNLVDVLGISLKGLDKEQAKLNSGVKNEKLCWENVLEVIGFASEKGIDVIVTLVCFSDFSMEKLEEFSKILKQYKNIYLKLNNYQPEKKLAGNGLKPMNERKLRKIFDEFLRTNPEWKGRLILISSRKAITNFKSVRMM